MKKKLNEILETYGPIALATYLVIFALVLVGFATAIEMGFSPSSAAESTGVWTAAYIATKLTQPLRIGLTLLLTPFVAAVVRRVRPVRTPTPPT
ncbi:MAG: hypothetical protein HY791_04360 [Deltaproteobacteria bacterium]|nr:hypothetical protein [Deltaproteobacteria bacterium]